MARPASCHPQLPDRRLVERAHLIRRRVNDRPHVPLTQAMNSSAEIEGAYRLLENRRVKPAMLLEPALETLIKRLPKRDVLAIHDSTQIRHATAVDADDTYELGLGGFGYLAHATLVIEATTADVLGIGGLSFVERARKATGKPSTDTGPRWGVPGLECLRWADQAIEVDKRLKDGGAAHVVHVMDREADMYEAMMAFDQHHLNFVIRVSQTSRLVDTGQAIGLRVAKTVGPATRMATREVGLSMRKKQPPQSRRAHPTREPRVAQLEIRAMPLSIRRPVDAPKSWKDSIPAGVVHVVEMDPPDGVDPIRWVLWTNLVLDTPAAVLRVVDIYRRRWLIEETFKVLKSGCHFEKKRFESAHPSQNALAFYLPIAAELLRLRNLARQGDECAADSVVDATQLIVLREFVPHAKLPKRPTVREVVWAIALLGGHLKQNGEPGWSVLARGYEDLRRLSEAWRRARSSSVGNEDEM